MVVFAKTFLLIGLVLLNTPHFLCSLTCAAEAQIGMEVTKCPHCGNQDRSTSENPIPPADGCRLGCCDQEPGVLVPVETQAETHSPSLSQSPTDFVQTYVSVVLLALDRVDYWPPPPSSHPGSQLSILFERFLL